MCHSPWAPEGRERTQGGAAQIALVTSSTSKAIFDRNHPSISWKQENTYQILWVLQNKDMFYFWFRHFQDIVTSVAVALLGNDATSPDFGRVSRPSPDENRLRAKAAPWSSWGFKTAVNPRSDIHEIVLFLCFFFPSSKSCPKNLKFITVGYYFCGFFYDGYCTGFFRKKHVSQMRTSRYPVVVFGQLFASTHCWLQRFPAEPSFCRSSGGGRAELHRETRQM